MLWFSFLASEPFPFPAVSLLSLFGHRCLSCRHMNICNMTRSRVLLYSFLSVVEKPFYIGTQRHGRSEKAKRVNVIRKSICALDVLCRYLFPDRFWQIHSFRFAHFFGIRNSNSLKHPDVWQTQTDEICSSDRTCPGQCHREALNIHTRPSCHQIWWPSNYLRLQTGAMSSRLRVWAGPTLYGIKVALH